MNDNIETADGFRRVQIGNLRNEYGYPGVYVDVSAPGGSGDCSITIDAAGQLRSCILSWSGDLTNAKLAEIRRRLREFIAKHEAAIRALNPLFSWLGSPVHRATSRASSAFS